MEKLAIKNFLHSVGEASEIINRQLEALASSPNLNEKDVAALNIALTEARSLIVLAASPLEQMNREEMRLHHSVVTHCESNSESYECAIRDVSPNGALIWFDQDIKNGEKIAVNFPEIGMVNCTVLNTSDSGTHIKFDKLSVEKSGAILETALSSEHV